MKNFCNTKEAMTKRKRAFTLVEVLIVVVIIGILFVTLMVNLGFSTDKANMAGVQNDFHAFQTAIKLVAMEEQGLNVPIESLKLSINKKLDTGLKLSVIEGGSMYSSGVDPWGTEYRLDYSQPANTNGQIILISAGPDNKYDTSDDIKSTIRYDTGNGNKVVVDGEILEQDTSIFNTELTFKPEINNTEFDNAFDTCSKYTTSSMLAVSPTSFTTYTLVEGANYSITGSKDAVTGIRVIKYIANGVSYWHLNQEAAAYVGQPESGWYTVNGATYTKCNTQLSVNIANNDDVYTLNQEGLKYLFNGVHEHDYSSKVMNGDYIYSEGTCVDKAVYYFSCTCGRKSSATFEGEKDPTNHPAGDENYLHEYIQKTADNHIHKSTCLQCHEVVIEEDQVHDFGGTLLCKQCNAIKHTHNYSRQLTDATYLKSPATCTSPAYYYYVCETCEAYDETKAWPNGSALGHEGAAATCTTAAVCTRCNNTYQAALGHNFTRQDARTDLQVSEATCTKPAVYYYLCARCDEVSTSTWNDLGSVLGHAFNKQATDDKYLALAATCVTPAKYYFSCRCGEFDANGAMFESGTANGSHIGGTRIEYEQIADDYTYHTKETVCETCSMVLNAEPEAHKTQDNLFCYLCDFEIHVCDYSEKKEEDAYLSFPATCTTTAVYYFACTEPNCTKHGVSTYPSGAALEHTYTSRVTTDPTCTEDGIRTYTCTRFWINPVNGNRINCNHEYTDSVPALGHEFTGEFPTPQYLARPATCMDPAAYYFCCEREGCGAASGSTFLAGRVDPNAHFGELIAVGTADICSRYSCCNGGEVREHTYLLDASKYYWGGYEDGNTDATGSANCSEFWMEAVCGCGYVNKIGATIRTAAQTEATCTADGVAKYHYVSVTINGVATTFKCNEHNTPLKSTTSDYAAYRNAYFNEYHKVPQALGHNYPSSISEATVHFDVQDGCERSMLQLDCRRCNNKEYIQVYTTKRVTVNQTCGVAEEWVMVADFGSYGITTCVDEGCDGHYGERVQHLGTEVNGGTAAQHIKCSECGGTLEGYTKHSFTAKVSRTGHSTTTAKSPGTLSYTVSCSCGYSLKGKATTTYSSSQTKYYCRAARGYYTYSFSFSTGYSTVNSAMKTACETATKAYTNRTDLKCCGNTHLYESGGNHNPNSKSYSISCSNGTLSSAKMTVKCSVCSTTIATVNHTGTPTVEQTTAPTCTSSGKGRLYIKFIYNNVVSYSYCNCKNHVISALGHNYTGSYQADGCMTKHTYDYKVCSRCSAKKVTDYHSSTDDVFFIMYGDGWETHGSYTGVNEDEWYYFDYLDRKDAKVYSYWDAGDVMKFCAGGNWDSEREKARIYISTWNNSTSKWVHTEVGRGSTSQGAYYTWTFNDCERASVYFETVWENAFIYHINIYIYKGVDLSEFNDYVHSRNFCDQCS